MTNSTADRLVDDYLTRLADEAQALPPDRRTELVAEIREHIAAAMTTSTAADEPATRTMLDRLGEPHDIVAAAMEFDPPDHPTHPQTSQRRQQGIGLEVGAAIMLTAGSLIPIVGWLIGVMLLWSSGLWRRSEKILATLIFPGGPGLVLVGAGLASSITTSETVCSGAVGVGVRVFPTAVASGGQNIPSAVASSGQMIPAAEACTSSALASSALAPVLWIGLLLLVLIAPVVVAIVLLNRARSRAASDVHETVAGEHITHLGR
jgi:uncharacterized membrane protein